LASYAIVGAVAPENVEIKIRAEPGVDLSTCEGATIEATHQDGTVVQWQASVLGASAAEVSIRHVFVEGDIPRVEIVKLVPLLDMGGGVLRRCYSVPMPVLEG
jgi:hypothetical protein